MALAGCQQKTQARDVVIVLPLCLRLFRFGLSELFFVERLSRHGRAPPGMIVAASDERAQVLETHPSPDALRWDELSVCLSVD